MPFNLNSIAEELDREQKQAALNFNVPTPLAVSENNIPSPLVRYNAFGEIIATEFTGAPSLYSEELAERICTRISSTTLSLRKISKEFGISYETLRKWIRDNKKFHSMYQKAKEEQTDNLVDEAIEISDEEEDVAEKDMAAASMKKLRVETRLKVATMLNPRKYGKQENVKVDVNVNHNVNEEQFADLKNTLLQKKLAERSQNNDNYEEAEELK